MTTNRIQTLGRPDAGAATRFLDERQLSTLIAVPVRTLQRWRLESRGPRFRKLNGSLVRYAMADVDAWIAASPVGGDRTASEVAATDPLRLKAA
jgi:predicted DNA-binding transcriptional regulator AlpA